MFNRKTGTCLGLIPRWWTSLRRLPGVSVRFSRNWMERGFYVVLVAEWVTESRCLWGFLPSRLCVCVCWMGLRYVCVWPSVPLWSGYWFAFLFASVSYTCDFVCTLMLKNVYRIYIVTSFTFFFFFRFPFRFNLLNVVSHLFRILSWFLKH